MPAGYYRFPTIHADTIVFTCEDDLWSVPAGGGLARRLTAGLGEATRPLLSPDGSQVAFVGRNEGQAEVYVMPILGGPAQRLTYLNGPLCQTAGWTADGQIIFANSARQPFPSLLHLYTIAPAGGQPQLLKLGPARAIAYGPGGACVIGRNTGDPARWKRYRGGTAGQLWIDPTGQGKFRPLLRLKGNLACPVWLNERIYFLSDHEGYGNLYSCLPSGKDLRRHTDHADFYARNAASDGRRIVYHAGADLYIFDPATDRNVKVEVEFHSSQTQRSRRFVDAARYLHSWALHPKGHSVALTCRGQAFSFANWEGAVLQHGQSDEASTSVRYRLLDWLNDGQRLVAVSDAGGEERFVILRADGAQPPAPLPSLDIGRPVALAVNPRQDQIVFSNHRHELLCLDLATHTLKLIDRGKADRIAGFDWSPDGEWVAYAVSISLQVSQLKLWKAATGEVFPLTRPVLRDAAPAFDPQGKYLYFLSYRYFDPVADNLQFDYNFPRGVKPYLITLQKDTPSPFIPLPKLDEGTPPPAPAAQPTPSEPAPTGPEPAGAEPAAPPTAQPAPELKPLQIDLEGIENRVVAFPVEEGRYGKIVGLKNGKVFYSIYPVEGSLRDERLLAEPPAKGALMLYSFEELKEELFVANITNFDLSRDTSALIYRAGNRLRVLRAGEKPDNSSPAPGRKSGWLDLGRIHLLVVPGAEWRQMFREAWRLQRDHFWTPDMAKLDWVAIHDRYLPLVDRVSSRGEFSDLLWEMQGELGTSHAYEYGGDYRPEPDYDLGALGAEFTYDAERQGWRVTHIVQGDPWSLHSDSPLNGPGLNIQVGDVLLAVNGRRLSERLAPEEALLDLANSLVTLSFAGAGEAPARTVTVKTLKSELGARYRAWVEANRRRVHAATDGAVGYVHIPDMSARGYAEFHRGYLAEVDRPALIIDLRFNGGGQVSSLLLEKLARRRIGYDTSRWSDVPTPYPPESVLGPMVALTNEFAGSDGDIFSHGFKLLGLGPLLGKRTWGGVVGIWPRHNLVDGTITTQPEFSFWFEDVGWGVENYGTDPDIEIDNTPQDYARGVDAQLERAILEAQQRLAANPPKLPEFKRRPRRTLPKLPDRS